MLTLLALLAFAAPAPNATISLPPRPLIAGRTWNATLVVKPAPRSSPKVVARPTSGRSLVFRTRRVGRGKLQGPACPAAGRALDRFRADRPPHSRAPQGHRLSGAAADLAAARRNRVPRVRRRPRAVPPVRPRDRLRLGLGGMSRSWRRPARRPRHGPGARDDQGLGSGLDGYRRRRLGVGDLAPRNRRSPGSTRARTACRRRSRSEGSFPTSGQEAERCGRPTMRPRSSSAIDPGTNAPIARVRVGNGPAGLCVRRDLRLGSQSSREHARPDRSRDERRCPDGDDSRWRAGRCGADRGLRRRPLDHRPRPRPAACLPRERLCARPDGDRRRRDRRRHGRDESLGRALRVGGRSERRTDPGRGAPRRREPVRSRDASRLHGSSMQTALPQRTASCGSSTPSRGFSSGSRPELVG